MTEIKILRGKGRINGFTVRGHSGYAEHGGDIVCAAVSALAITAANSLTDIIGIKPIVKMDEAYMSVLLPDDLSDSKDREAQIVMKTIEIGFRSIADEYKKYVKIIDSP